MDEKGHKWMLMFLGHRIADRCLLGLICKWLKAGVMEDGRRAAATKGAPYRIAHKEKERLYFYSVKALFFVQIKQLSQAL